jgi:hypothetical protein
MSPYRQAGARPIAHEAAPTPRRRSRHYPIGVFMTGMDIRDGLMKTPITIAALMILLIAALILARSN